MLSCLVNGVDINAPVTSVGGTCLHLAIERRMLAASEFLLLNSASPNAVTNQGNTALHIAAMYDFPEVISAVFQFVDLHSAHTVSWCSPSPFFFSLSQKCWWRLHSDKQRRRDPCGGCTEAGARDVQIDPELHRDVPAGPQHPAGVGHQHDPLLLLPEPERAEAPGLPRGLFKGRVRPGAQPAAETPPSSSGKASSSSPASEEKSFVTSRCVSPCPHIYIYIIIIIIITIITLIEVDIVFFPDPFFPSCFLLSLYLRIDRSPLLTERVQHFPDSEAKWRTAIRTARRG